jgi:hypothetical protein
LVLSVGKLACDAIARLPKNVVHKSAELCMTSTRLSDSKLLELVLISAAVERSGPAIIQLTATCPVA